MAWWDQTPMLPPLDVAEHKPVDTGLVDRGGNPIRRPPNPLGFHKPKGRG